MVTWIISFRVRSHTVSEISMPLIIAIRNRCNDRFASLPNCQGIINAPIHNVVSTEMLELNRTWTNDTRRPIATPPPASIPQARLPLIKLPSRPSDSQSQLLNVPSPSNPILFYLPITLITVSANAHIPLEYLPAADSIEVHTVIRPVNGEPSNQIVILRHTNNGRNSVIL